MFGNVTRRVLAIASRTGVREVMHTASKSNTVNLLSDRKITIPTALKASMARSVNSVVKKQSVDLPTIQNTNTEEGAVNIREGLQKSVDAIESMMAEVQSKADALRKAGSNNAAEEMEALFLDLCDRMKVGELETKLKSMKEIVKELDGEGGKENKSSKKGKGEESFFNRTSTGAKKAFSRFGQSFKKALKLTAKVTAASMILDLIYSEIILSEKVEEKLKHVDSQDAYKEVAAAYFKRYADIYEEIYQDLVKDLDPATKALFEAIRNEIVAELQKNQKANITEGFDIKKMKGAIKELVLTDHKLITAVSIVAVAVLGNPSQDVLEKLKQGKTTDVSDVDKARVVASIAKSLAVKPAVGSEKFFTSLEHVFAEQHLSIVCRINKGVYNALDAMSKVQPTVGV